MSDPRKDLDHAERIRRLQQRQAPSGRTRRRHPAARTRAFLGGLSVASFLTMVGALAVTEPTTLAATPSAAASAAGTTASAQTSSATTATTSGSATSSSSGSSMSSTSHTVTRGS